MKSMENVSFHLLKNTGRRICLVAKGNFAVDMSAVRNRERGVAAGLIDQPEWVKRMQRCSTASSTMELESINFSAAHFRRSRKK